MKMPLRLSPLLPLLPPCPGLLPLPPAHSRSSLPTLRTHGRLLLRRRPAPTHPTDGTGLPVPAPAPPLLPAPLPTSTTMASRSSTNSLTDYTAGSSIAFLPYVAFYLAFPHWCPSFTPVYYHSVPHFVSASIKLFACTAPFCIIVGRHLFASPFLPFLLTI